MQVNLQDFDRRRIKIGTGIRFANGAGKNSTLYMRACSCSTFLLTYPNESGLCAPIGEARPMRGQGRGRSPRCPKIPARLREDGGGYAAEVGRFGETTLPAFLPANHDRSGVSAPIGHDFKYSARFCEKNVHQRGPENADPASRAPLRSPALWHK